MRELIGAMGRLIREASGFREKAVLVCKALVFWPFVVQEYVRSPARRASAAGQEGGGDIYPMF